MNDDRVELAIRSVRANAIMVLPLRLRASDGERIRGLLSPVVSPHAIGKVLGCGDEPGESAGGFDWVPELAAGI